MRSHEATMLLSASILGDTGFQHPMACPMQAQQVLSPVSTLHSLTHFFSFTVSLSSSPPSCPLCLHSLLLHCSSPALIDISLPSPKQSLFLSPNARHVHSTFLGRREQSAGELVSRYIINALAPVLGIHLFWPNTTSRKAPAWREKSKYTRRQGDFHYIMCSSTLKQSRTCQNSKRSFIIQGMSSLEHPIIATVLHGQEKAPSCTCGWTNCPVFLSPM